MVRGLDSEHQTPLQNERKNGGREYAEKTGDIGIESRLRQDEHQPDVNGVEQAPNQQISVKPSGDPAFEHDPAAQDEPVALEQ